MVPSLCITLHKHLNQPHVPNIHKCTARNHIAGTNRADPDDDEEPTTWDTTFGPYYGPSRTYMILADTHINKPTLLFSQVLPHMSFQIGPEAKAEHQGFLRCMINSLGS